MAGWLDYAASDFLLFSAEVYWRLFVLENAALWPLPVVAPVAFVLGFWLAARRPEIGGRVLAVMLAIAWLSVGHSFVFNRYGAINWLVVYLAPLFAGHAVLWFWVAMRGTIVRPGWPVTGVVVFACVLYPFLAIVFVRAIEGAELAGVAPDPTALLSLGAAAMVPGRPRLVLALVPTVWLILSAVTLGLLGSGQSWVVGGATLVACGILALRSFARPSA